MSRDIDVYFIPLPEPVPMPRNIVTHFQYDDRGTPYVASVEKDPVGPAELLEKRGGPLDVAIRFTPVPTAPADFVISAAAAVSLSEYVTGVETAVKPIDPRDFIESKGDTIKASKIITVAEVAVFADADKSEGAPVDVEIEDLTDPLLRAIHCLQQFVRAYNLGVKEPVKLPTYQRIGPHVLCARRIHGSRGGWEHYDIPLSHENYAGKPPRIADIDFIKQWHENVQLLSAGDVRALFEDTMADAIRLLTLEGDHAGAVLKSAQASEVLLDGTLGLLLWESCGEAPDRDGPIEAAVEVLKKDLRPRLRTDYHPLLGGTWDLGKPGPLADWENRVATPRNRVVHRGYRPRADEAAASLNATRALDQHLMGLVNSRVRKFPRTALMLVGREGLKQAGVWAKIRAFDMKASSAEPPWRDNYACWRDRVDVEASRRSRSRNR